MEDIKFIEGYNEKYKVSTTGDIYRRENNEYILAKQNTCKLGYKRICLNRVKFLVHRLVAFAFIPNPNHYPMINHIDNNPSNNNVENLEWCTNSHNQLHSYKTTDRRSRILAKGGNMKGVFGADHPQSKKIKCLNNGVVYVSIREMCKELNLDHRRVWEVLKNKREDHRGYTFELI